MEIKIPLEINENTLDDAIEMALVDAHINDLDEEENGIIRDHRRAIIREKIAEWLGDNNELTLELNTDVNTLMVEKPD